MDNQTLEAYRRKKIKESIRQHDEWKAGVGIASWWREKEALEERRRKTEIQEHPCYKCVWFHEQSLYCPFPDRKSRPCFKQEEEKARK